MTTQTLSEAGQKLADALRTSGILWMDERSDIKTAGSETIVPPRFLNTAAALLFTPPEGEGAGDKTRLQAICEDVERELGCGGLSGVGIIYGDFAREVARRYAALASPQPAVQGLVAAGVSNEAVEAASAAFYDTMIGSEREFWPHHDGWAGKNEAFKTRVRGRMRTALEAATLTPPADPKTPDAGVGSIDTSLDVLIDGVIRDYPVIQETLRKSEGIAQPAPAGEDDTGVREALAPFAAFNDAATFPGSTWSKEPDSANARDIVGISAPLTVGMFRAASVALAPQPPKAETPAGVVLDGLTLEQLIHNYGAAEYNAAVDANEGAEPEHYEQKIAEAKAKLMQGIAALSTAPAARPGDGVEADKDRLDWLEKAARKSRSGISFDHIPSVEGERSGFRFMRKFFIGDARDTLRSAIDAARGEVEQMQRRELVAAPAADGGRG